METWTWNNAQAELSDNLLEILFSIHNPKTRYYLIKKLIRVSKRYKQDNASKQRLISNSRRQALIDAGILRVPKQRRRRHAYSR